MTNNVRSTGDMNDSTGNLKGREGEGRKGGEKGGEREESRIKGIPAWILEIVSTIHA